MPPTASKARTSQIEAIKKRIVPVSEVDAYLRILLYARNGREKTRTAATGPKTIVLDFNEKGGKSIRHYEDTYFFHTDKWEDATYMYWYLRSGDHPYQTVVLDTMTALSRMCVRHILREGLDRDPLRDPATMTQRDWGKLGEYMGKLILDYRNLPMHVVFLAQAKTIESENDEGEVTREVGPSMQGMSRGILMDAVDVIGYLYKKEVRVIDRKTKKEGTTWEVRMLTGPSDTYPTKDQTGALPRIMRKPSIPEIIRLYNEKG